VSTKLNPQRSTRANFSLPQADQPSRQRVTYVGFDDCDIRGSDRATGVHVFAEIRAHDRLADLRFGLGDIGGIDGVIAVHITDQHAMKMGMFPVFVPSLTLLSVTVIL